MATRYHDIRFDHSFSFFSSRFRFQNKTLFSFISIQEIKFSIPFQIAMIGLDSTRMTSSIESKLNHHNRQPPFLLATIISSIRRLRRTQGHWNSSCIIRHIPQQGINPFALRVLSDKEAGRDFARIRFHHHPLSVEDETRSSPIRRIRGCETHFMIRR